MKLKTISKTDYWLKPDTVYELEHFYCSEHNRDTDGYIFFPIKLLGISIQIDYCDIKNFDEESIKKLKEKR